MCFVTAAMNEIGVRIDIMLCLDVILSVAKLQPKINAFLVRLIV